MATYEPITKEPPPPPDPTYCPTCLSGFEPPHDEFEEAIREEPTYAS